MTRSKLFFFILLSFLASLSLSSCRGIGNIFPLSEEEVITILEAAMSHTSGGLTENLESLTEKIEDLSLEDLCDSLYQDVIEYRYEGGTRQASHETTWSFDLTCSGLNVPQSALVATESESNYDSPRISSADSSVFRGDVSGLQPSQSSLLWSGNFQRSGAQEMSREEVGSITSVLNISIHDLSLSKETSSIESGSGTFRCDLSKDGQTHQYTGTLTFHGDGTATAVINGESYSLDLN